LEANLADLQRHARVFEERSGFTYTVLERNSGEIIGCVYIYPPRSSGYDADVRSWVRADRDHLDSALYGVVDGWLVSTWPFRRVEYACRP
ncbi:MAG: N-acetyltransferase, partial [Candidatus Dormibacteraceae bacterium]